MVKKFKEFRIGSLFEKLNLRCLKADFDKNLYISKERNSEFSLPLVNAKNGDNGIMYYGRKQDWESAAMTIDIVNDGAVSAGNVYPQIEETGVLYNAYLIRPRKKDITEGILLYLATVIGKTIKHQFSYDNKAVWDRVKEINIKLPIVKRITPNYAELQTVLGGGLITMSNIDTSKWKEFRLKELFEVYHGKRLKKEDRIEGSIPLVTAGAENQGIAGYISNAEKVYKDAITIDMFGNSFYHDGICTGDDNIYFYVNDNITKEVKLFIVSVINKQINNVFSYSNQFRQADADNLRIKLPVTEVEEIDWDFMDKSMRALEKVVIADVVKYKDRVIQATKEIVGKKG